MSIEALLPMMEVMYNRKTKGSGPVYKIVESNDNSRGKQVVATRPIEGGAVILVEKALHSQPVDVNHPSLLTNPEYQSIVQVLKLLQGGGLEKEKEETTTTKAVVNNDHNNKLEQNALDRLGELNAAAYIMMMNKDSEGGCSSSNNKNLEEIWKLEDSHRFAKVGDTVMIDGLSSQAGKKLNGKCGRVSKKDENDPNRLGVEVSLGTGCTSNNNNTNAGNNNHNNNNKKGKVVTRSIKVCNLKTLGGIMRTNAYHDKTEDTTNLFKDVCRINHACGDSANVYRTIHHGKVFVTAKRDIIAGEEILVDYIPSVGTAEQQEGGGNNDNDNNRRRQVLQKMFNFWCQCPEHTSE